MNLDDQRRDQVGLALHWERLPLGIGGSSEGRAVAASLASDGRCAGSNSSTHISRQGGEGGGGEGGRADTNAASGPVLQFVLPLYCSVPVPEHPMAVPPPAPPPRGAGRARAGILHRNKVAAPSRAVAVAATMRLLEQQQQLRRGQARGPG